MERVLSEADSQPVRNGSLCQASETSQTAAEYVSYLSAFASRTRRVFQIVQSWHIASRFIDSQLQLEADAREALPYVRWAALFREVILTSCRPLTIAPILSAPSARISFLV